MLVLTRRVGEQIVIAGDIHITVVAVHGDKVRLGITAPESVRVDREEVHAHRAAEQARRAEEVLRRNGSCPGGGGPEDDPAQWGRCEVPLDG
jgi:carbon storage regulator